MTERTVGGLRCSEVLAQLSDYLDGELAKPEVERIEEHLLGCPNCERFGDNFGSMVVSLQRQSDRSEAFDSDLVSRLLSQIDQLNPES